MSLDFRAAQIQTNKIIASGSTGTETGAQIVVYSHLADDGTAPNQGFIDQTIFNTGSIGTDIFLYVSGGIGEKDVGGAKSITCFGGDVHISGNLTVDGTYPSGGGSGTNFFWSPSGSPPQIEASGSLTITGSGYFKGGLSGSLQEISSGVPYLLAGPNITITTNSLGQVEITGSASGGGGGSSFYRLEVLDYAAVNDTNSTTVGQVIFPANQFTGSIILHGVVANSLSTATGSVQLYNVTSGSYVEIGGPGITHLSVSGTNPTIITSVDLISASNFNSSSQAIYELQVSSSNGGSYGFFGGFELRPSGSFTGISYVTASYFYTYTSGTWEDGGNKLATTSSVAIAGNHGTGFFADDIGADVFFYVSGNNGGVSAGNGVSLFGGDVVISGTLYGGSPIKIGSTILQQPLPALFVSPNSSVEGNNTIFASYGSNIGETDINDANNAIIASSDSGISGSNSFNTNRNIILASDTANIYASQGSTAFNCVVGAGLTTIDSGQSNVVAGSSFINIVSGSAANSINSSIFMEITSGSILNAVMAGGDAYNFQTISTIEKSMGSAIIAGGPNVISSSDGNTIYNSAIIGSNWTITSSWTYAIGDTINPAAVLISASRGVEITGQTGFNSGLRYNPTIVTTLPHTASLNDYIIAVSASAGPGIELPASEFGKVFIVKDVSGSAAIDIINITAAGGELIDGSPNAQIGIDYGSLKFVYFGSGIGWGVV